MSSLLEEVLAANRSFLKGTPRVLDDGASFMVLSCIDPRLTGLLDAACGLPRGRALVLRCAGNQVNERTPDTVRSIAAGVYLKEAAELLVIGHTDCALARFSSAEVIERFRSRGVPRDAFGHDDLRVWFGAFGSVRENVVESVRYVRRSGILPAGFPVHALVIDIASGALERIEEGTIPERVAAASAAPARESASPAQPAPPPVPRPTHAPSPTPAAAVVSESSATAVPFSLLDAAIALREFLQAERQDPQFRQSLSDLALQAKRDKNPITLYNSLERTARQYHEKYPRLPRALEACKKAILERGAASHQFVELLRRVVD
jgi:carbonic anhydrase